MIKETHLKQEKVFPERKVKTAPQKRILAENVDTSYLSDLHSFSEPSRRQLAFPEMEHQPANGFQKENHMSLSNSLNPALQRRINIPATQSK